jgi:hypothetical protein
MLALFSTTMGVIHFTTRSYSLPFKGVFILEFLKGEKINEREKRAGQP